MAIPGRVEEGLIQHRYGFSYDLPDYLEEAEIAMTVDTGGVFIGAPLFKPIDGRERSYSNIYPYHNIEILTEVSNNSEIIKIPFNIFNTALNMPIVLIALNPPVVTQNDIIAINGVQLRILPTDSNIQSMVKTFNNIFNNQGIKDISFDVYDGKFKITFYSRNGESLILDSLTNQGLQHFGFVNDTDSNIIHKVVTPNKMTSRTLGEILSDRISIKTFGVVNNEDDNCSILTNAAIDLLYRTSQNFLKKDLLFPAGKYSYETDAIYTTSDASITGEHNTTLMFNNASIIRMLSNTDILGYYKQSSMYGTTEGDIKHIKLENLNLETEHELNGIELYGVSDLDIKNINITSNKGAELFSIKTSEGRNTFLKKIDNINIDSCVLDNGVQGIYINGDSESNKARDIVIKNVKFTNISEICLHLVNCKHVLIENCDFSDASNEDLLIKIENSEDVIIKNCIYPDNFALDSGANNKMTFIKSDVEFQDYFYKVLNLENTTILHLPQEQELYNLRLDYDVLSSKFVNKSGILTMYHMNTFSDDRIVDTCDVDSSIQFILQNGNNRNQLKLVCTNMHDQKGLLRFKLHYTTLKSEY